MATAAEGRNVYSTAVAPPPFLTQQLIHFILRTSFKDRMWLISNEIFDCLLITALTVNMKSPTNQMLSCITRVMSSGSLQQSTRVRVPLTSNTSRLINKNVRWSLVLGRSMQIKLFLPGMKDRRKLTLVTMSAVALGTSLLVLASLIMSTKSLRGNTKLGSPSP